MKTIAPSAALLLALAFSCPRAFAGGDAAPGPEGGMDTTTEDTLMDIGVQITPRSTPAPARPNKSVAAQTPPVDENVTDYAGIGSQILNPAGGLAARTWPAATPNSLAASGQSIDTPVGGVTSAAPPAAVTGLSYNRTIKIEQTMGNKATALGSLSNDLSTAGSDAKLSGDGSKLAPAGTPDLR